MNTKIIRLLLVEDDELDAMQVRRFLTKTENISYEIDHAPSLQNAFERIKNNAYHIILLDLNLPDSNQLETLQKLNEHVTCPIVVLTGVGDQDMALTALQNGAHDYLTKGEFNADALTRCIHYAVERYRVSYKLKHLLETAQEAFVAVDQAGLIVEWNPKSEQTFGWTKKEVVGKPMVDFIFPSEFRQSHYETMKYLLSHKNSKLLGKTIEMRALHRLGHEFPVEFSINAVTTDEGLSFNAFVRDISERKKLEETKDRLLATVSHEIRNPLSVIKMTIEHLKKRQDGPLSQEEKSLILASSRNMQRIFRIIHNTLDLSRLESGHAIIKKQSSNLKNLVDEVLFNFKAPSEEKKVELISEVSEAIDIYADHEMIIQVLNNLISNALRFTRSKVKIKAVTEEYHVRITVEDDGLGISLENQKRLFNKFEQVERIGTESGGYKGTGLGLAICHEIVVQHEGKIWIESIEGVGTQFHFTVPLVKA